MPDELIPELITRLAKESSQEGDRTMSDALAQTQELLIRQYGAEAVLTGEIPDRISRLRKRKTRPRRRQVRVFRSPLLISEWKK